MAGCASQPYAAASNHRIEGEAVQYKAVLDSREQAQLEQGFRELGQGHLAVDPPIARGLRWADVRSAFSQACAESEMAVINTVEHEWGYEFQLITIEDFPGVATVRRTNDERIYVAQASIGRFNDHPERVAALLKSFDDAIEAYGKKRSFADK